MHKILLASSSPYRQELLARLKIPFITFSPDIDETPFEGETIADLVKRLSKEKALAATRQYPDKICIGSDELAAMSNSNTLLGKPLTHENAVVQLKQMSGQQVDFYTGVWVSAPFLSFDDYQVVISRVYFLELSDRMIENYLHKEKPYMSAASFKSETLGSALISRFEGDDPTAIIGLPLIVLSRMLRKVGVEIV